MILLLSGCSGIFGAAVLGRLTSAFAPQKFATFPGAAGPSSAMTTSQMSGEKEVVCCGERIASALATVLALCSGFGRSSAIVQTVQAQT